MTVRRKHLAACSNTPKAGFTGTRLAALCLAAALPFSANAQEIPQTADEIIEEALEGQTHLKKGQHQRGKNYCQIVLGNEGVLREVPGLFELSSKSGGGRPGTAQVMTSNSSYRLSVDAPLGFHTAPKGGNDGVVMTATFNGHGASNFSETPGNIQHKLKRGTTSIEAHLVAHRNGEPFPAGNYAAVITLRCE